MIYTLTLNPSLDKSIIINNLIMGEGINRAVDIRNDPGGKGINVCRVLHRLGKESLALGLVGGYTGLQLQKLLDQEGISHDFLEIKGETRTNLLISDQKKNRHWKINEYGPEITSSELSQLQEKLYHLYPLPEFLILSGSLPVGVSADIYRQIILSVKSLGVKTVLDCEGLPLRLGIKGNPFLVKPNRREAEELLGKKLRKRDDLVDAAFTLLRQGIKMVSISRGVRGAIIAGEQGCWEAIPPRVSVRSTVGAGDSFLAGLIFSLAENKEPSEALRFAVATGAASVLATGTGLCQREDAETLFLQVKVRRVEDPRGC